MTLLFEKSSFEELKALKCAFHVNAYGQMTNPHFKDKVKDKLPRANEIMRFIQNQMIDRYATTLSICELESYIYACITSPNPTEKTYQDLAGELARKKRENCVWREELSNPCL